MDILLVDDDSDLVLGRPDLIVFRCRKTGMIIGASLGFEAPSFASFVAGLRHAMYPKDMSGFPAVRMPWPCFGRIENLWVDNALHFIGDDIRAAARELKMNKPRFKPKCPWLKGLWSGSSATSTPASSTCCRARRCPTSSSGANTTATSWIAPRSGSPSSWPC
ncbi:hypothetical protein ACU4GA_24200 [Methylobacterium oryzae CBMB20]